MIENGTLILWSWVRIPIHLFWGYISIDRIYGYRFELYYPHFYNYIKKINYKVYFIDKKIIKYDINSITINL